jgi:hypothetical protein
MDMRITWKDGVTTLATAMAVALERAYTLNWDLPFSLDLQWVVAGLFALVAVSYIFSYVLDSSRSTMWTWTSGVLIVASAIIAGLGMVYGTSVYVVTLMISAVVFWAASVVVHVAAESTSTHGHTYA